MTNKLSFEEFLRQNKLVQEKYVSFYVYWVKGFRYACKGEIRNLTYENLARFLNGLEGNYDEWKIRQAADALSIYLHNYLQGVF